MVDSYIRCQSVKRLQSKESYMHHLGSSAAKNERLLPTLLFNQMVTLQGPSRVSLGGRSKDLLVRFDIEGGHKPTPVCDPLSNDRLVIDRLVIVVLRDVCVSVSSSTR